MNTTSTADIVPTATVLDSMSENILHPSVLDMCFQTLITILFKQNFKNNIKNTSAFLPIAVGHIKVLAEQLSHTQITEIYTVTTNQTDRSILADFYLYDKNNTLLVKASNCRFRKAELITKPKIPDTYQFVPHFLSKYSDTDFVQKSLSSSEDYTNPPHQDVLVLLESLVGQYLYEIFFQNVWVW